MKAYVIAIPNIEESMACARRCIKSAAQHGVEVELKEGITPADDPQKIYEMKGISTERFKNNPFSRYESCISAFMSHHSLWEQCLDINEEVMVLEHDAVFVSDIPKTISFDKVISLGKPSYGKFNTPPKLGINRLSSKPYFPGAHAYILNPLGAKELVSKAKTLAQPTDLFLNLSNFPWLQEYYPWPIEVKESFSTIQKLEGCQAKHNYGEGYRLL